LQIIFNRNLLFILILFLEYKQDPLLSGFQIYAEQHGCKMTDVIDAVDSHQRLQVFSRWAE
jgi:hypothetical protein